MSDVEALFERWKALLALAETGPDRKTFTGPHDYIANTFSKRMSIEDQGRFVEMVANYMQGHGYVPPPDQAASEVAWPDQLLPDRLPDSADRAPDLPTPPGVPPL